MSGRLGLASWLFFLDRKAGFVACCDDSCLKDGRMGDVFREL